MTHLTGSSESSMLPSQSTTTRFYEDRALEYFDRTVHADLRHLYERFLPLVPKGGRILDAGCGSGRDLKVFRERGYRPFGIDSSRNLIQLASSFAGVECEVNRLQDIVFTGEFDAIWACASLLHLRKSELGQVLDRLYRALVSGGVFFATIQLGQGEQMASDGRFYAYYNDQEFLLAVQASGFAVEDSWISEDSLPNRPTIRWLNVLAYA